MTISLFTPSRTVLLIGDESLYVYKVTHNAARLVDNVSWQTDDFEDVVVSLIKKDCDGKPVLILNDMTDQHFKGGQRMPKVGVMDKANVLKRKLQVAFPNYPIRGALPVRVRDKSSGKLEGFKQGGGLYLFAAVPVSEQIVKTLEAVKQSMASIAGFALLPVESSDMVATMAANLAGKNKKPSRWVVFMGQHQNGALRQVITRDGQLAMTRMTPVSDPESDPGAWAHEVSQEFKATISYLSRFGYSVDEGTDVIVVAREGHGDMLGDLIDTPCNYSSLTVQEAARLLGMKVGIQEDAGFAEPLHVAWAGRKTKFILPMDAAEISSIHKPRQAVAAAVVLLLFGAGYLSWQLLGAAQAIASTRGDLQVQQGVLAQAKEEYEHEAQRMAALGFDVKVIQGAIATYKGFETDRVRVLPVVKGVGDALGDTLRLDKLTVNQTESGGTVVDNYGEKHEKHAALEAKLSLSFPPSIQIEDGMKEINNLARRLRAKLPDYNVEITQQIGRPEYTESMRGEVGDAKEAAAAKDYVAEVVVRGPKQ